MKRTFSNVNEGGANALASSLHIKSKKVRNTLSSDSRFSWPETADAESITTSSSSCDSDDYDFFTTDLMQDEDWFNGNDMITEDDWQSVASLDCNNPCEMEKQPAGDLTTISTAEGTRPATLSMKMDPDCYNYFRAEYAKYVETETSSGASLPVSFEDFVVVTLEMIASFTKSKANSAVTSSEIESSFDFSIQNWQKKVEKQAPPASRHGVVASNSLLNVTLLQDDFNHHDILAPWQHGHEEVSVVDDQQFQFCDGDDFALQPIYCF